MGQKYVLDTNFFINRQRPINLGENIELVVENFTKLAWPLIKSQQITLLTTPDSYKELTSFFKESPLIVNKLGQLLVVSSYNRNNLQINGLLFEELIAETGRRLYRGLRTAEDSLKEMLKEPELLTNEAVGNKITKLREKYRRATKEGFIDSTIDLGLIFLAKNKEAIIVSSDNGLLHWARNFGCHEELPEVFVEKIRALNPNP